MASLNTLNEPSLIELHLYCCCCFCYSFTFTTLLKYHPLNRICFSNFVSTFDAIHGGGMREKTASFGSHHLLAIAFACIMNSCAYFRDSNSSSQRQQQDDGEREIRGALLYREWGDEENIDYYVLPFYPLALQIKAAAAISAFHYAIFLSLSLVHSVFYAICMELELRQWKMSFIMISTFLPCLPASQPTQRSAHSDYLMFIYIQKKSLFFISIYAPLLDVWTDFFFLCFYWLYKLLLF